LLDKIIAKFLKTINETITLTIRILYMLKPYRIKLSLLISELIKKILSGIRYFRNDGILGTVQTTTYDSAFLYGPDGITTVYLGIRVFALHTDLTETEITSDTAVAIASTSVTGMISATWECPLSSLVSSDKIRVKVYGNNATPPTSPRETFDTEVLNAINLDSRTWTVYYYIYRSGTAPNVYYRFRHGDATTNSRIENFGIGV